jgi:acyl dehydratase
MLLSSRSHALFCRSSSRSSRWRWYQWRLQAAYHGILSQANASRPDSHVTTRAFTQSNDTANSVIETIRDGVCIRGSIPAGGIGVAVGQYAEVERIYTMDDVEAFGRVVRDGNPLHRAWKLPHPQQLVEDTVEGEVPVLLESLHGHPLLKFKEDSSREQTPYSLVLVHGMLVASLFTSIFGTLIPGAVYSQQSLHFVKPVYVGHTAELSSRTTTTTTTSRSAVTGRVTIQRIRKYGRNKGLIVTCDTVATNQSDKETVLHGQATVWLPRGRELVLEERSVTTNQAK